MHPLTLDELVAALDAIGGFENRPLVAVGVSGGPDSMALMLLADRWARARSGRAVGLTVDHGLRPESAAEARAVAGWLAARGIPHETLIWTGAKPATGIEEAARDARYGLLAEWCQTQGCLHLLVAHHRDDQRETHLIRRGAGSGPDGLAAMSAIRELPGCRLIRPLLWFPRAHLAAFLEAEHQPFLQDPTNLDPTYERARLRLAAKTDGEDATDFRTAGILPARRRDAGRPDPAVDVQAHGRQRIKREQMLAELLARSVSLHPVGFAALDPAVLVDTDPDTAARLLARLAICIGVAAYPPRRERLARLRAGLRGNPNRPRTLGGCRFVPWRGHILVLRELAAAAPPALLEPGTKTLWDRRIAATLPPGGSANLTLGYLGQSGLRLPKDFGNRGEGDLPRLVYPVLPALWDDAGLAVVPSLGYCRPRLAEGLIAGLAVMPCISFRPAQPLAQPAFTVVSSREHPIFCSRETAAQSAPALAPRR